MEACACGAAGISGRCSGIPLVGNCISHDVRANEYPHARAGVNPVEKRIKLFMYLISPRGELARSIVADEHALL